MPLMQGINFVQLNGYFGMSLRLTNILISIFWLLLHILNALVVNVESGPKTGVFYYFYGDVVVGSLASIFLYLGAQFKNHWLIFFWLLYANIAFFYWEAGLLVFVFNIKDFNAHFRYALNYILLPAKLLFGIIFILFSRTVFSYFYLLYAEKLRRQDRARTSATIKTTSRHIRFPIKA